MRATSREAAIADWSNNWHALELTSHAYTEVAQLLLEYGANLNVQTQSTWGTPLIGATKCGHLDTVRLLLGHGADVHLRGLCEFETALQWAIDAGHHEIAQLLLEHGAGRRRRRR